MAIKPTPESEPEEDEEISLPYIYLRTPLDFMQQIEEFGAITREGGLTFFKEVNEEVVAFARQSQGQKLYRLYFEDATAGYDADDE